jgi:hypothetical protein
MNNFEKTLSILTEEKAEPLCTAKLGKTELVIKYPDSNERYAYDIGLETQRDKYFYQCQKRQGKTGTLINKIKQFPDRKL